MASGKKAAKTKTAIEDPVFLAAARRKVAEDFYRSQGFPEHRIANHLKGIDFSKPVDVVTLEPGTKLVQYQAPGNAQGNYYAPEGVTASELGISPLGIDARGNVVSKVGAPFTVTKPVQVLKSTAAPIEDTWSLSPYGAAQTKGGGTQFFTTENGAFGGQ